MRGRHGSFNQTAIDAVPSSVAGHFSFSAGCQIYCPLCVHPTLLAQDQWRDALTTDYTFRTRPILVQHLVGK
jgi:hypothetical protein